MITSNAQLSHFLNEIKDESLIALDTEFKRVDSYFPELCLIQIATKDKLDCIDVLAIDNLEAFNGDIICIPIELIYFPAYL